MVKFTYKGKTDDNFWICPKKYEEIFKDMDCRKTVTQSGNVYVTATRRVPYASWKDSLYAHILIARIEWSDKMNSIGKHVVVHHKDGNGENNALSNLLVLSAKEHLSLHKRQRENLYTIESLSRMREKRILSEATLAALLEELHALPADAIKVKDLYAHYLIGRNSQFFSDTPAQTTQATKRKHRARHSLKETERFMPTRPVPPLPLSSLAKWKI
jgi:hypothetical protein